MQLTLCWTASVVIIADLISFAFPSFSQSDIGFKGIHVHKNVAGFAAIMCGTILAFSVPQLRTPTSRFFTITLTVLAFVLLVLSKSKTNLFVLLILIGMVPLYLLLIRQQEAKLRHFVLTCVICALIFLIGASGSKLSALGALYGDPTLTNRAVIWVEVEKFIAQSPWTGIGFGSFWDTGGEWNLFPVGYYVFYNDPSIVNVSHNGYVDVLLHGGRIALFFGYVVTANVLCFTLAIATGSSVPRHHKWTFCMLHCLIIMILVQNLTESSMFFPSSSSSYFFLILLAQAARWKVSLDDNKRQIAKYARHMAIDPNSRIPSSMSRISPNMRTAFRQALYTPRTNRRFTYVFLLGGRRRKEHIAHDNALRRGKKPAIFGAIGVDDFFFSCDRLNSLKITF